MAQAVIGSLRVNLGLDSAKFSKGLKTSQSKMAAFGKSMQRVGVIATAMGVGVALALKSQLNAADEMSKAAQKFGVPIEQLSQLKYAAELSGVAFGSLGTGLTKLAKNMDEAAQGNKEYSELFDRLGLKVANADGTLRDSTTVLTEMSDAIAALPDGAEKTALAVQLLGRSGADLIPLMNGGSDAVRGMMREADALGLTITSKTGKAAEQFNDNLARLKKTLAGIGLQLAASLAPALEAISNKVVEASKVFRNLSDEMQSIVGVSAAIAIGIGPVLISVGFLVKAIMAVGRALAVMRLALIALSGPWGIVAGLIGAAVGALVLWQKGIKETPEPVEEARVAMGLLNETLAGFQMLAPDVQSAALTNALAYKQQAEAAIEAARAQLALQKVMVADAETRLSDAGAVSAFGSLMGQNDIDGLSVIVESLEADLDVANARIKNVATSITSQMAPAMAGATETTKTLKVEVDGTSAAVGKLGGAIDDIPPLEDPLERAAAAADRLTGDLSNTFASIVTGSDSARDAVGRLADSLASMIANNAFKSLLGSVIGSGSGFGKVADFLIGGNANGTSNWRGGLTMVGERGKELVNLPGGSQVFSARDTKEMMGGGAQQAVHVANHFHIAANGDDSVRAIIRGEVPRITQATTAAVLDAKRRGGAYGSGF